MDKIRDIVRNWKNLLRFNEEYFSIFFLLRTFFSYWRNYHENYSKGLNIKQYFAAFTFNIVSRLLGSFARFWIILVGVIFEGLLFIGGLIFILSWVFLPLINLGGIIFGIKIIT